MRLATIQLVLFSAARWELFPRAVTTRRCAHSRHAGTNHIDVLARGGKTLQRLGDLVALVEESGYRKVADIGTDHGLLAVGLGLSGYDTVGVDLSEQALDKGGRKLLRDVTDYRQKRKESDILPVEFRCGDGLEALHPGEADVVCIAGVGVHTVMDILGKRGRGKEQNLLLNVIDSQQLCVQPTNSRPKHLMLLYDGLDGIGWRVCEERISYVSSRWYISSAFRRVTDESVTSQQVANLPGEFLMTGQARGQSHHKTSVDDEIERSQDIFQCYVEHHRKWIERDAEIKGHISDDERRWLERFSSIEN